MIKDIVIKAYWIKRELIIIVFTYVLANFLNFASILVYQTDWKELYTSQLFVLYVTEWLYIISVIVRLIYVGFRYVFKRK
jgi:hypothetical protein